MMNADQFLRKCRLWGLDEKSVRLIENIRNSQPSRKVQGRYGNVIARFPSRKMGHIVQAESHTVELPAIYLMENDSQVLEFWDQPNSIKLFYPSKAGRNMGILHTPDFFVLHEDGPFWLETKPEEGLIKESEKNPNRYIKIDEQWHCPPGEMYAQEYGLQYQVWSSKDYNTLFISNLRFLWDYYGSDLSGIDKVLHELQYSAFKGRIFLTLKQLLAHSDKIPADNIYTLIAAEKLFVDLENESLTSPEEVRVFQNKQAYTAFCLARYIPEQGKLEPIAGLLDIKMGTLIEWDGKSYKILHVGKSEISLLSLPDNLASFIPLKVFEDLAGRGIIQSPTEELKARRESALNDSFSNVDEKRLAVANKRQEELAKRKSIGSSEKSPVSERTCRRWEKNCKYSKAIHGTSYPGLIPNTHLRGNRNPKLPKESKEIMNKYIDTDYANNKQTGSKAVYRQMAEGCKKEGIIVPSYKTFLKTIKQRNSHEMKKKREGSKSAYASEPFYHILDINTPKHGVRPFEICHMDHTQLDIELVSSINGENLGRPWLSIMIDAFSRRILAFHLNYDPPSYRTLMMVLRECVKRHHRFPSTLVLDNGKEFNSHFFEALLATYECVKKSRPAAKGRFGSVCERLFGTINTQFIYSLTGNTQPTKKIRQLTKAVNPKLNAIWNLAALNEKMEQWFYEIYDNTTHSTLGESPRLVFENSLLITGERSSRIVAYDENFLMMTLPSTKRGTAKIVTGKGVKVNYTFYWNDIFRSPEIEGSQVHVRYDPYDLGMVYAFVKGNWIKCDTGIKRKPTNMTEKELMIAAVELKSVMRIQGRTNSLDGSKLAQFIDNAKSKELSLQRERDAEVKRIRAVGKSVTNTIANFPISESKPNETATEIKNKWRPDIKNLSLLKDWK